MAYKDKNLLHFSINKNANISQRWMAYEPENWDTFNDNNGGKRISLPEKDFERHILNVNKTPEFNQELIKRQYPNYFISVFIRDPIKRFASAVVHDYTFQSRIMENINLIIEHPNYLSDFEKRFVEFSQNPSFENLRIILHNGYTCTLKYGHCYPQNIFGWFDHLPEYVEYFDVNKNLTQNYRHWLIENNFTKYHDTPINDYVWHRNDSSKISRKDELQDIVMKYMTDSNTLTEWVYDYYALDFEMYERLKPRCYSHKKTAP